MRCWYLRPEELSGVESKDGSMLGTVYSFKDFTYCCPLVWNHLLLSQKQRRIGNERPCITTVIQSYSSFLGLLKQNLGIRNRKSRCHHGWHLLRAVSYLPWLLAASGVPWFGDDVPHLSSYHFPLHMSVSMCKYLFFIRTQSYRIRGPSLIISSQLNHLQIRSHQQILEIRTLCLGGLGGNTIQSITQSIICSHLWLTWDLQKVSLITRQPTPVLLPGKSHGRRSLVQATVHRVAKSRT